MRIGLVNSDIPASGFDVSPEKVADKHTSLDVLALAAKPGDGANVVGDHHQGGAGQVLLGSLPRPLLNVHLTKATGHDVTREVESVVITSVNILH